MIKRLRFAIVLSLLFIIGAFQYATPLFLDDNQQSSNTQSSFKVDVSYESTTQDMPDVHVSDYGQVEQGSFFLQREGQQGYLLSPLLDTKVDINVTGLVARAKVTQVFTNTSEEWVNGIYVFPLPENAAVDHLEMHIGNRRIVGEIHPKQKAKAIYEQAKREGKKASLLVQERPNLFKNSVANIGPGERIQVTIEYQQAVTYKQDTFSLRFPTTVTERYLPKQNLVDSEVEVDESGWGITQPFYAQSSQSQELEPLQPQNKVAMNITLNTGFELDKIKSEFHPIAQAQTEPGRYEVSLKQDMIANQDFVLSWQPKPNQHPKAAHFVQQTKQGHYGMVMLMPPDIGVEAKSLAREVVFIIDTSGSMSGDSMQQAKMALAYAVQDLPATDTFNLIEFDSEASQMWASAQPATAENKDYASDYIASLSADGGTEMLSALQLGLGQQTQENKGIRQVIFITDGSVGNETQLFAYIQDNLQKSRLFTVGIGSAPNSFFMSEAARMGKGTFTYIGSINSVQLKMQSLFSKLTHPVLADLLINFSEDVEFYPRNIPDLYKDEPVMVSYKSDAQIDNLTVTGTLKNQYWQKAMSLQKGAKQNGLDVLWARRKIAQLDRDKLFGQDFEQTNKQILDVAMNHHLVSSMTSLVAVDKTPTALDVSRDSQVKNAPPKGLLRGNLPQTATAAQLQFLLALLLMGAGLCTVIFTRSR